MIVTLSALTLLLTILVGAGAYIWSLQGGISFWEALANIGTILGILSFIPLVYAIWEYIRFIRREEKEREIIHTQTGTKPAVLIVDIGGAGIRNEVEAFLREQEGFNGFDFDSRMFVVHRDKKQITANDVNGIIEELETNLDMIRIKAADKIHLFLKVPMPVAVMVGEVLANRTPALVYHKQHNKGYENWGSLHR